MCVCVVSVYPRSGECVLEVSVLAFQSTKAHNNRVIHFIHVRTLFWRERILKSIPPETAYITRFTVACTSLKRKWKFIRLYSQCRTTGLTPKYKRTFVVYYEITLKITTFNLFRYMHTKRYFCFKNI